MLDQRQVAEFAARGFVLLPRVVPMDVVAAAAQAIDELIEREPPGADIRGPYNYFLSAATAPELAALLAGSPAFGLAESLTGPGTLEMPRQVQVALNIPPFPHRPGLHHIDGFPPEPDGRPGTFTMLAGVLMSGQRGPDAGNLWVWPGTHLAHAEYFRSRGPDAFFAAGGYPPIRLPEPEQICGEAGTCCSRTTCWVTTSAATSRPRSGARSTSGSSGPVTIGGGAISSPIPGLTTMPSGSSSGETGEYSPAGSLASHGGGFRCPSRGRAARRSLCEQFGWISRLLLSLTSVEHATPEPPMESGMPHSSGRPRATSDRHRRGGERTTNRRAPAGNKHPGTRPQRVNRSPSLISA